MPPFQSRLMLHAPLAVRFRSAAAEDFAAAVAFRHAVDAMPHFLFFQIIAGLFAAAAAIDAAFCRRLPPAC